MEDIKSPFTPSRSSTNGVAPDAHEPYWTGNGFVLENPDASGAQRYKKRSVSVNLPVKPTKEPVSSMGTIVSQNAANDLILAFYRNFIKKTEKLFEPYHGIEKGAAFLKTFTNQIDDILPHQTIFGKEALLFLLSQPGCDGIRFYYCLNPEHEKPSLVLVGVNKDQDEIGQKNKFLFGDVNSDLMTNNAGTISISKQSSALVEVGGTDPPRRKYIKDFKKWLNKNL